MVIRACDSSGITLAALAEERGATLPAWLDPNLKIKAGASLETALPLHVAYMDSPRYASALRNTKAGACFVAERFASLVPASTATLVVPDPRLAYAELLARLRPDTLRPAPLVRGGGTAARFFVHPTARMKEDVVLDPGAVIGERATIGPGTTIGAHAVLGPEVVVGRDCSIGAGVTIAHARIGDRVILHPGVRIGQDGFGFARHAAGYRKVPQLGGVVIGDDVEIGANSTIDRGGGRDTVIGGGTKIDNLVQIAHGVWIGQRCIIIAQVGIAGSTILEDDVVVGGQGGILGHLHVGRGAQLAAACLVTRDVPAGERWGGAPARPVRQWLRQQTLLNKLTRLHSKTKQ